MSIGRNVKILTWLQICTIAAVIFVVRFYVNPNLSAGATRGMVDGILFSPDNPSALIDGQVLKIGDQIYGVEVVEISRRIVTFEKDGQTWEQRVCERPNSTWDDPNPTESDANDVL
ncbi:MAG TPA: hypothetical protein VJJ98_11060 [Sedimentisphaerales bacterium]|nr:hypothetical protein [Sedimentisphaerales bacterium]